jgi:hypothetical protein
MNTVRPFNKYIAYLTVFAFIALYIISFVFLFHSDTEIISFGFLTVFSIFFTLFIIDTIGSYLKNYSMSLVTGWTWFVLFSSISLKVSALILTLIMFRGVYTIKEIVTLKKPDAPLEHKDKKTNIPPMYREMINDYKILFMVNMIVLLLLTFLLMYCYSSLNVNIISLFHVFSEQGTFSSFKPLVTPIIVLTISTLLIVSSSYEVYFGNELYKLNNKRVGTL